MTEKRGSLLLKMGESSLYVVPQTETATEREGSEQILLPARTESETRPRS